MTCTATGATPATLGDQSRQCGIEKERSPERGGMLDTFRRGATGDRTYTGWATIPKETVRASDPRIRRNLCHKGCLEFFKLGATQRV